MSWMSRVDVGKGKGGEGSLNKQDSGQEWTEENARWQMEALTLIKNFDIGLLS